MAGESTTTTDHETIRKWTEARDGEPAHIVGTGDEDDAGLLRINFPGYDEENLEKISWDEFFEKFDEKNLAFLYQDELSSGDTSRFFKFVSRDDNE